MFMYTVNKATYVYSVLACCFYFVEQLLISISLLHPIRCIRVMKQSNTQSLHDQVLGRTRPALLSNLFATTKPSL